MKGKKYLVLKAKRKIFLKLVKIAESSEINP